MRIVSGRWRRVATGAGTVAVVAALLVAGAPGGYPATRPRLGSGAAWLPSYQVGQLTLLDGSTAEVAGQVAVAPAGDRIDAVQAGSTAYAVDRTTGEIRRVDGATFDVGTPSVLIPDARDGLRVFAATDALYAIDTERGLLARADARSLAAQGNPMPIGARTAALDGAGRLWVLDTATGDVVRFDTDGHTRRGHAGGGSLAVAGDAPVVVDTHRGTATVLDPDAVTVRRTVALNLRPDEQVEVSGSAGTARLYVVAASGVLSICDLGGTSCDTAVPVGGSGDDLGAAVESGARVFVPDYTTGQVWVVDVGSAHVAARASVLPSHTRFELLSRDRVVFFNDPGSARAGVIDLDGGVRPVAKYATSAAPGDVPSTTPSSSAPTPTPAPTPKQTPATAPAPPHTVRISASTATPAVGADVTLRAVSGSGAPPVEARWSFGDGTVATGLTVVHRWSTTQTYQVSVQATFADRRGATASVSIRVHLPQVRLTVGVSGPGRVTGGGITCPSRCQVSVNAGTPVTLTEKPTGSATFSGWGGACPGTATTCTVTVDADTSVSASFKAAPPPPTLSRSGTLQPGQTACVGPFFADGVQGSTHSVHFTGRVTDGSGAVLRWTVRQTPSGQTKLDQSQPNVTWDEVNFGANPDFPGNFTGCAKNETTAPVAYTETIGKGPF